MQSISYFFAQAFFDAILPSLSTDSPVTALVGAQAADASGEMQHIPLHVLNQFLTAAQQSGGNPDIGLLAYEKAHPGNLGMLGYAIMSSPTIRDALAYIVDFHFLVGSGFCMFLDEQPGTLRIVGFPENPKEPELPRAFIDAVASITLGLLHWLVPGQKIIPVLAEFTYPEPSDTRALKALFGPALQFSAENNALTFKREDGELPLATGNPLLQAVHNDYLTMQPRHSATDKISARTKSTVLQLMNQALPITLVSIAKTMKLTPHQLKQGLEREGSNVRQVVDLVKYQQSHQLLTSTRLSLKQISYRVAFKNQSAFNKACERWFGMPPGRYRATNLAAIDPCTE